jgi:hypothetical protein
MPEDQSNLRALHLTQYRLQPWNSGIEVVRELHLRAPAVLKSLPFDASEHI